MYTYLYLNITKNHLTIPISSYTNTLTIFTVWSISRVLVPLHYNMLQSWPILYTITIQSGEFFCNIYSSWYIEIIFTQLNIHWQITMIYTSLWLCNSVDAIFGGVLCVIGCIFTIWTGEIVTFSLYFSGIGAPKFWKSVATT